MDKKKKSPEKIYRPPFFYRLGFSIIFLLAGSLFATITISFIRDLEQVFTTHISLTLLIVIFQYVLFALTWYSAEFALNFKLIVTPDGLWFHGYGRRFYTWDSMIRLAEAKYSSHWGIRAYRAQKIYRSRFGKLFINTWLYDRFIPLVLLVKVPRKWFYFRDIEKFKETEFGQDLYHYAPHLFEDVEQTKKRKIAENRVIMDEQTLEREAFSHEQAQKKTQK